MAGMLGSARTGEIACVANTPKTVLQLLAASNRLTRLLRWGVSFDGTSSTGEPVVVQLMRQSTAGTMSALTPTKLGIFSETLQTSAQHTATAEPTSGDVLDSQQVHPQVGCDIMIPLDQAIWVPGGGRIAIVVTVPTGGATINAIAKMIFEE